MSERSESESRAEALPALLDLLILPGEVLVPARTWDESRAALEAADSGARRLVAVPGAGTSNIEDDIPAPLKDRLETIRLAAYTREEQVAIGRGHLLPRLTKGRGMTGRVLQLDPEVVESLVFDFPPSEGMRALEHRLATVLQRARRHHLETGRPIRVTVDLARAWVGEPAAERRIGFQVAGGIPSGRAGRPTSSPPSARTVTTPRACGCPQPGRGRPSPGARPVSRSLRKTAVWACRHDQIAQ